MESIFAENGKEICRALFTCDGIIIDKKTQKLFYALLDYLDIQENFVLRDGFSIGIIIEDAVEEPYRKELNIKLQYIDEKALNAYRNEKGTTEEG